MSSGPDEDTGWDNWQDFHREGDEPHFTYNPAASDITTQTGDFPEVTDVEAPEKM